MLSPRHISDKLSPLQMLKTKPPEIRLLEQTLQEKLIPWAQASAPLVLFDADPRASVPLKFEQFDRQLPTVRSSFRYPYITRWKKERLNSISVTVLGCIFEGEAQYRFHSPLPGDTREWVVEVKEGTLFTIAPNVPFSDGSKVSWEHPTAIAPTAYSAFCRGILIYLRRDGVSCRTFTCDKGKLWVHPYMFLYQMEAGLLGERLLAEMRELNSSSNPVASLYWQLILRLMMRSVARYEFSELKSKIETPQLVGQQEPHERLRPERIVEVTKEYIRAHLSDPDLSSKAVALYAGLSERHLNRLFHTQTGQSVFQEIVRQRDEKSCDLLIHSGISLSEVAGYCGFRRHSAFSAWFSKIHGCSPSAYRAGENQNVRKK
jgi:AraC-like DNA-binding protein